MKASIAFSSDTIEYIHKSIQEFIEDNYNDEMIFFDDIWEIYEDELKKWVGKPPRKWRLKLPKRKLPKVIGMTDGTPSIELFTPTIIETVSASYKDIAKMKENISLERIEKIIKERCGKKLPYSDVLRAVGFFAPYMFRDSEKMRLVPKEEAKKEIEMDSRIGEEIYYIFKQIDTSHEEDIEYKYIMYTEKDVKDDIEITLKGGRKLTEEWHSKLQNLYPTLTGKFRYILDFASEIFYFNEKELWTSTDEKTEYNYYKALAVILLYPKENQITFEKLYRGVTGTYNKAKARGSIHRWFTDLKHLLGVKKKDLNRLFVSWKGKGYKVVKKDEFNFLFILEEEMVQNMMKFSQL
jgi:hypothetical protein